MTVIFLLPLVAFVLTVVALKPLRAWLVEQRMLDHPNERSSHIIPTPRGGGLVVTPVIAAVWAVAALLFPVDANILPLIAAGLGLCVVSVIDDRRSLSARVRLLCHLAAVVAGLMTLPAEALVFQGLLPLWADRLLTLVSWLWMINLTNFMDGIDGISAIEAIAVAVGLAVVGDTTTLPLELILTASMLGFLVWNWHPAKIFLGDSGSVPLGYWLGWLLILAATHPPSPQSPHTHWAAALILPLYYLTDATLTLTRRALRGEKIWQAHRQHFYQRAAAGCGRHDRVVLLIAAGNLGLIACAVMADRVSEGIGLLAAAIVTLVLMLSLRRLFKSP